jgi:ABC-type nitrate/sulfonate/bicarbonate transport system substrate-binding protein
MLAAGEIDAATLPQPYYALSKRAGARMLIDDTVLDYVPEGISFLAETLAEKPDEVRAFMRGYERTLNEFNAQETFAEAMAFIGSQLQDTMQFMEESREAQASAFMSSLLEAGADIWPIMTTARVPTAEEFAQVQDWALAVGLVTEARAL